MPVSCMPLAWLLHLHLSTGVVRLTDWNPPVVVTKLYGTGSWFREASKDSRGEQT